MMRKDSAPLEVGDGDWIAERYQLKELLGQGRIGRVYRAIDTQKSADGAEEAALVAIKIPHSPKASQPQFAARFHREYLAGLRNLHPSIVRCLDVGEFQGRPYMVSEFVDGMPIDQWFSHHNSPVGRNFEMLAQVLETTLEAIYAAHQVGLVHKELKPSNWIVDGNNFPRLLDFGLAGRLEDQLSVGDTADILPGLVFLSPEQALGERGDLRSDLYSLGAILFYLASGRSLYPVESTSMILLSHIQDPVPSLGRLRSDVPNWLERLVHRLLQKDPQKRLPSCMEALSWVRKRHQGLRDASFEPGGRISAVSERERLRELLNGIQRGGSVWISAASSCCLTPVNEELLAAKQAGQVEYIHLNRVASLNHELDVAGLHLIRHPELQKLGDTRITQLSKRIQAYLEAPTSKPLVIRVDFFQTVDEELAQTLLEWIQISRQGRLVVIATAPDKCGPNLRPHFQTQIQMSGQTLDECALMIEERLWARPPQDLTTWLSRVSGGVPTFLGLLLESLEGRSIQVEGDLVRWTMPARNEIPTSLSELLGNKFSQLSREQQSILGAASCLGLIFERNLLRVLSLAEDVDFDLLLEGCVSTGWLVERQSAGVLCYQFSHPTRFQIASEKTDIRRQRRFHLLLGAFWERAQASAADWERALLHYERSLEFGLAQTSLLHVLSDGCDREAWDEVRFWMKRSRSWMKQLPPERQPDHILPTPWHNFGWGGISQSTGCLHYTAALLRQCGKYETSRWYLDVAWEHGLEDDLARMVENRLLYALALDPAQAGWAQSFDQTVQQALASARIHGLSEHAALASSLLLNRAKKTTNI
jgi:serine/threonine protein kinase